MSDPTRDNVSAPIALTPESLIKTAEDLLYYREMALGGLHQMANYLATIQASLFIAQMISEMKVSEIKNSDLEELRRSLRDLREYLERSMKLATSLQKRGATLSPVLTPCLLVEEVVRPAIEYMQPKAGQYYIRIMHSFTNHDFSVRLDRDLVKECFINILNNAVWAIRENKRSTKKEIFIYVRGVPEEKCVKVEIQDSGIGIEPENFPKLFTPFFSTRSGGTGLGLFYSRKIVEECGGTLSIPRSRPGKGTTVALTFPTN